MPAPERLQAVVAQLPWLAGRVAAADVVSGGLINESVRLTTVDGERLVVRLFAANSDELGIDREHEHLASTIAGEQGVGARVLAYLPEQQAMALEWIEGEAQSGESLRGGDRVEQAALVLRRLHEGPAFAAPFSIFEILRRYRAVVAREGYAVPAGFGDYLEAAAAIERALASDPPPLAPCHNDVMPANFIDTGAGMRLIDYEYAGMNEPAFDLGGLWQEAALDPDHLSRMVEAHAGRPDPRLEARARLYAIMWSYAWTLWAAIQAGAGTDFGDWDPAEWGGEHFARARRAFSDGGFARLLEAAR